MIIVSPRKAILFFLCFFTFTTFAQITKEQRKAFWQTPLEIKLTAIKSGKLLEYAKEVSPENFMVQMLWYKPQRMSKKDGHYTEEIIYQDSTYFFWSSMTTTYFIDFYKVRKEPLKGIDYLHLNREEIETRFKEEIIPATDKRKANEKLRYAISIEDKSYFKYNYIVAEKAMQITYRWKIECVTCISRLVNKEYQAKFNLITRQFIK